MTQHNKQKDTYILVPFQRVRNRNVLREVQFTIKHHMITHIRRQVRRLRFLIIPTQTDGDTREQDAQNPRQYHNNSPSKAQICKVSFVERMDGGCGESAAAGREIIGRKLVLHYGIQWGKIAVCRCLGPSDVCSGRVMVISCFNCCFCGGRAHLLCIMGRGMLSLVSQVMRR